MTDIDVEAIARRHAPYSARLGDAPAEPYCVKCGIPWPCDAAALAAKCQEIIRMLRA